MAETSDFYNEIGNEEKAKLFSDMIGIELKKAKDIFIKLIPLCSWYSCFDSNRKIILEHILPLAQIGDYIHRIMD